MLANLGGVNHTAEQYQTVVAKCRQVFQAKLHDYGPSWTVLRPQAVTDQLYIKARRLRQLDETGQNHVGEAPENEYVGLFNYAAIACLVLAEDQRQEYARLEYAPPAEVLMSQYDAVVNEAYTLMLVKNKDYGEAWRDMRLSSILDLMLMRLLRLRQLEGLATGPLASEGARAQYLDLMNYAIFALIKLTL